MEVMLKTGGLDPVTCWQLHPASFMLRTGLATPWAYPFALVTSGRPVWVV